MREPAKKKLPVEVVKRRHLEIERRLSEHGLARGPRRLLRRAGTEAGEESHCRRLSAALVSLGPLFSSFGVYLSSRVDLLSAKDCLELSAIPDRAEAMPVASVQELIRGSLASSLEQSYRAFEAEPFESRLIFQSHHALLEDGQAVTVKVEHPELEDRIACDMELLTLLRDAFASKEWTDSDLDGAIDDFRRSIRQQMDFAHEATGLEALARDSKHFDMLTAPVVHRSLSSSTVMTVERLPGLRLSDLFNASEEEGAARASGALGSGIDRSDVARNLCLVWLRQALLGNLYPVDPYPENILVLPDNRIAFTGGAFASLDSDAKSNLLSYLVAASIQDPDKACSCLIREMYKEEASGCEDELRNMFRQVVPFRDGGWSNRDGGESLAEHLFVHWKLARKRGYRPLPHLLGFYRGLFLIAASARRLDAGRDPMLEALENLRFQAMIKQFQEMIIPRQLGENFDKYALMMMELPRKLDEVLTLAAEGNARVRLQVSETAERRRQSNSSAVATALLIALGAIVLLSNHFVASASGGWWADRIGAISFLLFGALMLRAVTRRR